MTTTCEICLKTIDDEIEYEDDYFFIVCASCWGIFCNKCFDKHLDEPTNHKLVPLFDF